MNKKNFFICFALCAACLFLSGCDKDSEGEDSAYYAQCGMFVKFESPVGTNLIDSLNLVAFQNGKSTLRYDYQNDDVVLSRCVRGSDGAEIEFANDASYFSYWEKIPKSDGSSHLSNLGTVLYLRWTDPYIFGYWNAPAEKYDQTYTIYLKSPKIFGDDNERTIKWYVHVTKNFYDTYRCEINGVEFDFENSYIWDPPKNQARKPIVNIIPMPVPVKP